MNSITILEQELTYLPATMPPISGIIPRRIIDTYFPDDPTVPPSLRLRQEQGPDEERFEITRKLPVDPADRSAQLEETIRVTHAEFRSLVTGHTRNVVKDRYRIVVEGGQCADVDVFRASLGGLVLVDFEFPDEHELAAFRPPSWCRVEVTQKRFLAGGNLAGKSYEAIAENLTRLGYTALT